MESSPSLLSAGLAVLSALLYLAAVWRQVLNLEAGAEHQRQQIALHPFDEMFLVTTEASAKANQGPS